MAWFGQGKDTIEWNEFRNDVLFYKWPANEIKKGARLILRPGQKAIFYADGVVGAVFEQPGDFDIMSEIVPFFSLLKGWFELRGDTGMRAEVYFVNAKELVLPWGTRQRIMIPCAEVPAGIPIGCNGNLIIEFRDYQKFINEVAGVKDTYSLDDIADRIMGELNPIVAEAILNGEQQLGLNVLITLQQNSRKWGATVRSELDHELGAFGLGVADVNILSVNFPEELQQTVERAAAQAMVGDVGRYAAVNMANSFDTPNAGGGSAAAGAGIGMGMAMASQMAEAMSSSTKAPSAASTPAPQQDAGYVCTGCGKPFADRVNFCSACGKPVVAKEVPAAGGDRFCPTCRKMVNGKFCPDCGTQTV